MRDYRDFRMANRGQTLEQFIRFANERYKKSGIAVINKQHTEFLPIRNAYGQIVRCKVESKATVDFIGRVGNVPIAAEAKETSGDSIRLLEVQDHQADFLDAYYGKDEAICFVIVSFSMNTFYVVPWVFWKAARDAYKEVQRIGKRKAEKITITYNGQTWTTPGRGSIKESEMLPEWEVVPGGMYGLDYLQNYRMGITMC